MTSILGISAFYHDSGAALVVDGDIVAAAQEERFSRKKHDRDFPVHAISYCLDEAGISASELDYVGFYDKPLIKFERLLATYLAYAPAGYRSFRRAIPLWLKQKLHIARKMRSALPDYTNRFVFTKHHESHGASAFFPSPFDDAAIVTIDGVGEWSTTCVGIGHKNKINLLEQIRFPHSLGLLYAAFTYYTGFRVNSGEYKMMGLAPYGEPTFKNLILRHVMQLKDDGSFRMDMSYFNYCQGLTMTSHKLHRLLGGPPRDPASRITQRDMDLAASVQAVTEEAMMRLAQYAHKKTGSENLVLAGGVALNCVGNGKILRDGPFKEIWVQPAAGDAGGALGVSLFVWYQLLNNNRRPNGKDSQRGSFLGPQYSDDRILRHLGEFGAKYECYTSDETLCERVADLLIKGKVVGWFQGRMEFGPRALGARSILGDARSTTMQSVMNLKIKFRESFRPFAPVVLQEHVNEYFEMKSHQASPYMLLVAPVKEEIRETIDASHQSAIGIEKLNSVRSTIPAVTHVDYSARVQTVDRDRNPLLHNLMCRFFERTGCPVLINTSFNVRGEPIVCTPSDAYQCFMLTDMDALVLGHYVLIKEDQPNRMSQADRERHLSQFELD